MNDPAHIISPRLSIVVAAAENQAIGRRGDLPWRLSADLKRFKQLTMGGALVMGRKTYESIGRPLPGRRTIVLTRRDEWSPSAEGVATARQLQEALAIARDGVSGDERVFVVGGGEIYRLALPQTDRVYLTRVHTEVEGDATFPELPADEWRLIESERHGADEKNEHAFTFEVWERIQPAP